MHDGRSRHLNKKSQECHNSTCSTTESDIMTPVFIQLMLHLLLRCSILRHSPYNSIMSTTNSRPVAIITGGTRGIGSGIAQALAEDGFDLLLTYNSNKEAAEDFVATLKAKHGELQCELVGGDLSKPETRDKIFSTYDEKYGPTRTLGAAVHNAGQYVGVTSTNADGLGATSVSFGNNKILGEDGKPQFDHMHFYQALYGDAYIDICERSLARMTPEHGGSLIGISSPGCNLSYGANPGYSLPGSGKCIMEYSNRIIAMSAGAKNVNSNVIVPGVTLSDAWGKVAEKRGCKSEDITNMIVQKRVAMKRPIEVRGIGDVAAFLCSPKVRRCLVGVALSLSLSLSLCECVRLIMCLLCVSIC